MRLSWSPVVVFAAVACGSDSALTPAPVTAQVSLAPGAFSVLSDAAVSGAVEFPAASAGATEYLVVGQLAVPSEVTSSFSLGAQDLRAAQPQPAPGASLALRFHDGLRAREAQMAALTPFFRSPFPAPRSAVIPPTVGSKRTFKVCGDVTCGKTVNVPATAQFVGAHAAIFIDDSAPSGGFNASDLQQVGTQFDQVLYPIDHASFGAESDIDNNGVVIVLLTKQINALAPKPGCNQSFITGFFFGGDIDPQFRSQFNSGEIFYGLVPDPTGQVSCVYPTARVKQLIPVTFIHEFQHMISYNQHVLSRGGAAEELWLNEGMSHLAEELGGLHYDSAGVDTTASVFFQGDLYNAGQWMLDPQGNAMVATTPPGSLAERGAEWLFLRYVMDQFGPATSATLEQTALTGAPNLAAATGTGFRTLLGRWALALYLGDLPGFSAPSTLTYTTWHFRATFAQLHASQPQNFPVFPLQPDSGAGSDAALAGSLGAGSAAYLVVTQPAAGAGFQLVFRGVPTSDQPQLAIARLR